MRIMLITHWHHFSYLVISTALLGFGAAGTLVSIFRRRILSHWRPVAWSSAFLSGLTIPIGYVLADSLPLNVLQLVWQHSQWWYLLGYQLLILLPFFFGAMTLIVTFAACAERINLLYSANMVGSGLGVALLISMMYFIPAELLLPAMCLLVFLASSIFGFLINKRVGFATMAAGILAAGLYVYSGKNRLHISEYKGISYVLNQPGSRVLARRHSPLGRLDVVASPKVPIRDAPGLTLAWTESIPAQ
jgi:hypothetical protein